MTWFRITYMTREGAIGAVSCAEPSLEETKRGCITGGSEIIAVREVGTSADLPKLRG